LYLEDISVIEDKPASIAKISFDIRPTVSKEQFLMAKVPTWFLVDGQGGRGAAAREAIGGRGGGGQARWCRRRRAGT